MRVYQRINGCIVLLQLVRWQHGFPAQRTAQPVLLKAAQLAMRVHGMPARQHGGRFDRMEQIFQAHGTVRVEPVRLALMIQRRNARAAIIAVHKIIIPVHPANAALVAVVIISLNAIVKKVAHGAKVGGELGAAMKACVRHGLSFIARSAYHFFYGVPIHLVRFGVVVAVAAHICLVATRGH
jgi:hypothetical protein